MGPKSELRFATVVGGRYRPRHDVDGGRSFYDGTMLGALMRRGVDALRRRGELIPLGYNWPFVIAVDVTLVATVFTISSS